MKDAVPSSRRSELIETAIRSMVSRIVRRARHNRELAILNERAEKLNAEAAETLKFQSNIDEE